jgi:hypothetical protein
MSNRFRIVASLAVLVSGVFGASACCFGQVRLLEQKPDPHGFPRPAKGARDVPVRTSHYLELGIAKEAKGDSVSPDSVSIRLQKAGEEPAVMLDAGQRFAKGYSGWLRPRKNLQGEGSLAVYVDRDEPLLPKTSYTVRVSARSLKGAALGENEGSWTFTTEEAPRTHAVTFALNFADEPVHWRGAFFSGFGNVIFCTSAASFGPTYELMAEARRQHPRAWSLQRDFWMTGNEHTPGFLAQNLPNVVRERETRRIAAIEPGADGVRLAVEDFFGHRQYGIADNRPLRDDYHPGDEILVAGGSHDARAKVIAVDDRAGTVLVNKLDTPPGGWKVAYTGPLPSRENPDAPGLFPPGGCYLIKLRPHGTPVYYWGRLDKEWDLAHRRFGRRLLPNFADSPADFARDGRSWTTVKDYAEWHDVARTLAGHIIDRYGKDALEFVWSIFNEPDLGPLFWRTDWDELQKFYDYTTDAILRAFEDRGLDSSRVFIGGLELGGIFGTNLKLKEFFAHCSPKAEAKGALARNAAVADRRLDGKRSQRVEALCRASGGKGSPCDFVSIHSYNRSELMAAKLIRAKEMALEIDPEYYKALWVNSHESCPDWSPPPDTAAADSYLGNGYFPSWCLDVAARQLRQAARDPRYAFGETILTVWPPNQNFSGLNAVTRVVQCDDDGDGLADRAQTLPMPIFHVLGLLSDMGDRYWVLPERTIGGHLVSGFASRSAEGRALRIALYSHHAQDTQSRSDSDFDVTLDLAGIGDKPMRVREHRFDKDHNSYFRPARALRDRPAARAASASELADLDAAVRALDGDDVGARLKTLKTLERLGPAAQPALPSIVKLLGSTQDSATKEAAQAAVKRIFAPPAYTRVEIEPIQKASECVPTADMERSPDSDGRLRLNVRIAGNGLNMLVIEPAAR